MCHRCVYPRSERLIAKPPETPCDSCGHFGPTWNIHQRQMPPESPWPRWRVRHVCYACILVAKEAAA